ncbi:hypothetical protein Tco_1538606 [Tanacetum coccineum]
MGDDLKGNSCSGGDSLLVTYITEVDEDLQGRKLFFVPPHTHTQTHTERDLSEEEKCDRVGTSSCDDEMMYANDCERDLDNDIILDGACLVIRVDVLCGIFGLRGSVEYEWWRGSCIELRRARSERRGTIVMVIDTRDVEAGGSESEIEIGRIEMRQAEALSIDFDVSSRMLRDSELAVVSNLDWWFFMKSSEDERREDLQSCSEKTVIECEKYERLTEAAFFSSIQILVEVPIGDEGLRRGILSAHNN